MTDWGPAMVGSELEDRLKGPKRVGLFGHRNVGKTTLLAMFYRQAASGRIPGLRLAAGDPRTAEYLAEKIAALEAGRPMSGTLAETELALRLYHGPARLELIVKDYQGEHVALGSDEPIQEFFRDCDAVLLCLDSHGAADPVERRRRQQEIEGLLECYLDRANGPRIERPIALVLTKFDQVEPGVPTADGVERLVESRFGMTRHALAEHAPEGAIFAVSAFGPGAIGNQPPSELSPMGLEGPLSWLATQLEARDRLDLERLWETGKRDPRRLERATLAYEKRYPRSNGSFEFRARLRSLKRARGYRRALAAAALVAIAAGGLAGYDRVAYRQTAHDEATSPSPAVAAGRWQRLAQGHPTLAFFWPSLARHARERHDYWRVLAASDQVLNGTAPADLDATLSRLKDESPRLRPAIHEVEQAQKLARHDTRWDEAQGRARSLKALEDPAFGLEALDEFLREFPESTRRPAALAIASELKAHLKARAHQTEKRVVDDLIRAESSPGVATTDLIARAQRFLDEHPESPERGLVEERLARYLERQDTADIERARAFSRQSPDQYAARIERYGEYLKAHQTGGRHISEAMEARDRILAEWDSRSYRNAHDHAQANPDDFAGIARRLRDYQRDHADGRYAAAATAYLDWWDKVSVARPYKVSLRRGEVEPTVGKYLAGGAPDLGVVVEVAGVVHGPSPVIRDSHRPVWDYTFAEPIIWKLGDPVTIRIIDYDWSATEVYVLKSPQGDPLAIRLLSGTIKPAKGGRTTLVFASDFTRPELPAP